MVEIRSSSTSTKPLCMGRTRLSRKVSIVLLIATLLLLLTILSERMIGHLMNSSASGEINYYGSRQTDTPSNGPRIDIPSKKESETMEYKPSGRKFRSYPGFTGNATVQCGGHEAPTCDECPQGHGESWCNGQCEWIDENCVRSTQLEHLHPDYFRITDRYAFQPVMNNNHVFVNVIVVRSPFRNRDDEDVYKFYQDEILFLGLSSFESFPLKSPNPYSAEYESDYYLNMFPGFLHMMRDPNEYFPTSVKTILMSQSDFMLDGPEKFRLEHANDKKIYDFVYSGGVSSERILFIMLLCACLIAHRSLPTLTGSGC
jgi:hypothetical protein